MTLSVLIVHGSLTVRMHLADSFTAHGCRPQACGDLGRARELLLIEAFDVVVLDVLLPDGDGLDFLRELRQTPTGQCALIMLLSNETEIAQRLRGRNTFVGKPDVITDLVTKALELKASRGEILVIEDSPTFRAHLSLALQQAGHSVLDAESGEAGLLLLKTEKPSAVLIDGLLPGIDGLTVIRRIRSDAALRALPCVLLTASDDAESEHAALASGADAFVRKDHDLEPLLQRLSELLHG